MTTRRLDSTRLLSSSSLLLLGENLSVSTSGTTCGNFASTKSTKLRTVGIVVPVLYTYPVKHDPSYFVVLWDNGESGAHQAYLRSSTSKSSCCAAFRLARWGTLFRPQVLYCGTVYAYWYCTSACDGDMDGGGLSLEFLGTSNNERHLAFLHSIYSFC